MSFDFWKLVLMLSLLLGVFLLSRKIKSPVFFYSKDLSQFPIGSNKKKYAFLPRAFFWLALICFTISLCNPQVEDVSIPFSIRGTSKELKKIIKNPMPHKGIAIYLVIDISGSMADPIEVPLQVGYVGPMPKIQWVKQQAQKFIIGDVDKQETGRTQDLVGIIAFARAANIVCPLTFDKNELIERLSQLKVIHNDNENGTAIGYAIFKTVHLIVATKYFAERLKQKYEPIYDIKNQVIIVLTDGLQAPHPDDKNNPFRFMRPEESLKYARQNGVRVYFVGVDPIMKSQEFMQQLKGIKQGVEATGGEFYITTRADPLSHIFSKISTLEKSAFIENLVVETPQMEKSKPPKRSAVSFFLMTGLAALFCAIVLETQLLRRVP